MEINVSSCHQHDVSNVTYPNEIWVRKPDWEIAAKSLVLLLIVLLGVAANSAILTVICNRRHLSAPINYFFVNMAVADVATLLISPSMFLCRSIFQNYELGSACRVEGFFQFSFMLIDVFTLVAITCTRLLAILVPHHRGLSPNVALFLIVTFWISGFALTTPLIIFREYKERQWENFLEKYCDEDKEVLSTYWNVIVSLAVWVPLAVMLISYSIIFSNLKSLEKHALQREHERSVNFKKRAAKIIFTLVIVFLLCRMPFTALIIWRSIVDPLPHTIGRSYEILWFSANVLLFLNAALNPILYGLTNRCFRKSLEASKWTKWVFRMNKNPVASEALWTVPKLVPRKVKEDNVIPTNLYFIDNM